MAEATIEQAAFGATVAAARDLGLSEAAAQAIAQAAMIAALAMYRQQQAATT